MITKSVFWPFFIFINRFYFEICCCGLKLPFLGDQVVLVVFSFVPLVFTFGIWILFVLNVHLFISCDLDLDFDNYCFDWWVKVLQVSVHNGIHWWLCQVKEEGKNECKPFCVSLPLWFWVIYLWAVHTFWLSIMDHTACFLLTLSSL